MPVVLDRITQMPAWGDEALCRLESVRGGKARETLEVRLAVELRPVSGVTKQFHGRRVVLRWRHSVVPSPLKDSTFAAFLARFRCRPW